MSLIGELCAATSGKLLRGENLGEIHHAPLGPVQTDSRLVEPGDVFWALTGTKQRGERFLGEAFRRGALGAVVAEDLPAPEHHWLLRVSDTTDALTVWAEWKRRRFHGTVIGITGSAGKTTTREMIHAVMSSRLYGTASPRNFNNHLGVPLSMTAIEPDHDYAVLELGASAVGEIAALAALARPDIGVITGTGDAHLDGFGDRERIAQAKIELLSALPTDGHAVVADDPYLRKAVGNHPVRITWVGEKENCDLMATAVASHGGRLTFRLYGQQFVVPVWGRHHLVPALCAVAVGRLLGLPLKEIAAALAKFQPVPMRCQVFDIRGATIINDAYNSNPTAMRAALELLAEFKPTGRRVVLCGDMAELGHRSPDLHRQLGRQAVETGRVDLLIACGRFSRHVVDGACEVGIPRRQAIAYQTVEEILPQVYETIAPGDVVLIKGSRIMAMERLIAALMQNA